jgi:hypothetical protein
MDTIEDQTKKKEALLEDMEKALNKALEKMEENPDDYQFPVLVQVLQSGVIEIQRELIDLYKHNK